MDEGKRMLLEQAGWQIGSAEEFLNLSAEEAMLLQGRLESEDTLRHSPGGRTDR